MVWTPQGWQWAWAVLAAVVLYELLRVQFLAWLRRRQEARVDRFLREHRIPNDPFRHTHRVVVKELVLADPGLVAEMAATARQRGTDVAAVQRQVRAWLDEIVPQFNLFAYYRVGYRLARIFAYALYNVRLDKASHDRAMAALPANAVVVLVSNHRSNADFVVTGFMLSKSVQVSYAVGEWARVWPLESLFKSFGSYFVRRGEKDPLYHRTLRSYVELITKQGVTQAMFPEGALSRDGALRPAKLGLLDSMVLAKRDPAFTRPLAFVPVGINFDRVLEDEVLLREAQGQGPRRRSPGQKARRILALAGRSLVGIPANTARFLAKRLKKHGVCAIHFGEPLVLDDWLARHPGVLDEEDRHRRHAALRPLGDALMERIAAAIPVTPVPLVCHAAERLGAQRLAIGVDRGELLAAMRAAIAQLQRRGAPFFTGDPYEHRGEERRRAARALTRDDLGDVVVGLGESDDLDAILDRALDVLGRRGVLREDGGVVRTDPQRWDLVGYYANAVASPPQAGVPPRALVA